MIPYTVRRRIVDELNIVEVVSEYIKLEKKGNNHFGICPFHDDNRPSMSVSNKVKMFNCFSCNTKGDVITFVSKYENITLDQATIKLAKRIGLTIKKEVSKEEEKKERLYKVMNEACDFYSFYLKNSDEGKNALKYLYNRGINDEIIDKFKIGLSPNLSDGLYKFLNKKSYSELDQIELGLIKSESGGRIHDIFRSRIMFPLASNNGNVVGFSGRIYTDSNQAKYINSNENVIFHKGEVLYNMHNAALYARQQDLIYIFEGFMDVIAAYRASIFNGVATMGTALTKEHIKAILSVTKNIVLCFDGDLAGINAMKKAAALLSTFNIVPQAVVLPNNLDPDEYIKEYGTPQLKTYLISKTKPVYSWLYDLAYDKLIKNDVLSIENFKKNVFEFINFSHQATIVDFYLNKIANDLEVEIDVIKQDYEKNLKNHNNYINDSSTINNDNNQNPNIIQVINTNVKVTKSIKKAYEIIIKHCLFSNKALIKYLQETNNDYLCEDLSVEFSILDLIKTEQMVNNNLEEDFNTYEINLKILEQDETYKNYLDNILKDIFIDIENEDDFTQSLKTLKVFIKKINTRKLKNRVLNGDQNAFNEFKNSKKEEDNI